MGRRTTRGLISTDIDALVRWGRRGQSGAKRACWLCMPCQPRMSYSNGRASTSRTVRMSECANPRVPLHAVSAERAGAGAGGGGAGACVEEDEELEPSASWIRAALMQTK